MWYNGIMRSILRSPLHSIISGSILEIGFTGSKSGKKYTTPVNYMEIEGVVYILSDRSRIWWKNLEMNPDVNLFLKQEDKTGMAELFDTKNEVMEKLTLVLSHYPTMAKFMKVEINDGVPSKEDIKKLSGNTIVIAVTLAA